MRALAEIDVSSNIARRILEIAERGEQAFGGLARILRQVVFEEGRFTCETAHYIAPSIDFIRRRDGLEPLLTFSD